MHLCGVRTLFADQRVVPVVGIVRVAESSMRILKFEKLVAVLARVTRALKGFIYNGRAQCAKCGLIQSGFKSLRRQSKNMRTSICANRRKNVKQDKI